MSKFKVGDKIVLYDDGEFIGTIKYITDSRLTKGEKLLHGDHVLDGVVVGSFANIKQSKAIRYDSKKS